MPSVTVTVSRRMSLIFMFGVRVSYGLHLTYSHYTAAPVFRALYHMTWTRHTTLVIMPSLRYFFLSFLILTHSPPTAVRVLHLNLCCFVLPRVAAPQHCSPLFLRYMIPTYLAADFICQSRCSREPRVFLLCL